MQIRSEYLNNGPFLFRSCCRDLEAGMNCIKRYTLNCMKEKQREHFNSLYTGTNMAIMELCQDGPYQDGECLNLNDRTESEYCSFGT